MNIYKVTRTMKFTWTIDAENNKEALNQALNLEDGTKAEYENNWKIRKVENEEG